MDLSQLTIALIGAASTLLGAWLNSRSKQSSGATITRRSMRRRILKFSFYFVLGGVATYWIMNSVLPFGRIDERLNSLEVQTEAILHRSGRTADTVSTAGFPPGSVIFSTLSPKEFGRLPDGFRHWVPADGRIVDSLSLYALFRGTTRVPDLHFFKKGVDSTAIMDSLVQQILSPMNTLRRGDSATVLYGYVRIN